MSKRLDENIGTVGYDGLIVSNDPVADVVTVELQTTISGGTEENPTSTPVGVVKRGTVITGTPGGKDFIALAAAASGSKALYVLADDVDTAVDAIGTAYRTGHFARNKLIVAAGYTLTAADEEALRKSGILLSDALDY